MFVKLYNISISFFIYNLFIVYFNYQFFTMKAAPAMIFLLIPPSAFIGKSASKLLRVLSV